MKRLGFALSARLACCALASIPLLAHSAPQRPSASIALGDGTIVGTALVPYDNVWLYTLTTPQGKVVPQGLWSDHVQMTLSDGKSALLRVQGVTFVTGKTSSTVNVFDPQTLAPLSARQQGIDGEVQTRIFSGTHVTAVRTDKSGVETHHETDLPAAPYDFNGGMYGMILVGLPLRAGLTGTFNSIEESRDEPAIESFKVIGRESVNAGTRGKVDAWKVLVERPGQYTMTFWISKAVPYIIKLEYSIAGHAQVWDWNMI